jgi:hypothetical protein
MGVTGYSCLLQDFPKQFLREALVLCTQAVGEDYRGVLALPFKDFLQSIAEGDFPPTLLDQCVGAGEDAAPVDYTSVITQISHVHSVYGSETYVIALPGSEQPTADGRRHQWSPMAMEGR